jgi:hypothetical protein
VRHKVGSYGKRIGTPKRKVIKQFMRRGIGYVY